MHVYLRTLDGAYPNLNSFSITSSPLNQRIEAFWSHLQRDRIGWRRQLFQDLVDLELFSIEDPVLVDNIRFCLMDLLKKELIKITEDWNSHIISPSRYDGIRGRPDTKYFLSHLYVKEDFKINIDEEDIDEFCPVITTSLSYVSDEFGEFARNLLTINDELNFPPNNAHEE